MRTMHSTLLVGPYDWDPGSLPKEEFTGRLDTLWRLAGPRCAGAFVYGDSRDHAELAYFSNFVPKFRHAMALFGRGGNARLLVAGDAAITLPAASRLTWIDTLGALSDPGTALAQWLAEAGGEGDVASLGERPMRLAFRNSLREACGMHPLRDATDLVRSQMRSKRPLEIAAIAKSCSILQTARLALEDARSAGASLTQAIDEAEHAARLDGAQDVRSLSSLDGGRTLEPFYEPAAQALDPWQIYLAVRSAGYWAEGFLSLSARSIPVLDRVSVALRRVAAMVQKGKAFAEVRSSVIEEITPYQEHAATAGSCLCEVGLALEDDSPPETRFESQSVYSLRIGASDGKHSHAIVSAMIAVKESGNELLWCSV